MCSLFFFQAEDGIRDKLVTGVQTCALPICKSVEGSPYRPAPLPSSARRLWWPTARSEERRGGKEWRSRWAPYHLQKQHYKNATFLRRIAVHMYVYCDTTARHT